MKVIKGTCVVPVIYTAHHASYDFGEFEQRIALTDEEKIRFSDYGTAQSIPSNGIAAIISEKSRALGDLNRHPESVDIFQEKDFTKPIALNIWKTGQNLTQAEKAYCIANYYEPFHSQIEGLLKKVKEVAFVVAWDNTANYEIGKAKNGEQVIMKPIILSNRGSEGVSSSTGAEITSCDPKFLEILAFNLENELSKKQLPSEVHLNLVMRGGYICQKYSTRRNKKKLEMAGINSEVQSFQVEYNTLITHNQETLEVNPGNIKNLKEAFSNAITYSYNDYLKTK